MIVFIFSLVYSDQIYPFSSYHMMQNNRDKGNVMKDMNFYLTKLQESLKRYEEIEMQIYDVNQLKLKASVELEEIKKRDEMIQERLKGIHDNYLAWIKKINSEENEEEERANIQKLTTERDNLRERLVEYKRSNDEDNEKIEKLVTMIKVEKNKYAALLRKLETASQMKNIPQNLRDKANAILNSPSLDQD